MYLFDLSLTYATLCAMTTKSFLWQIETLWNHPDPAKHKYHSSHKEIQNHLFKAANWKEEKNPKQQNPAKASNHSLYLPFRMLDLRCFNESSFSHKCWVPVQGIRHITAVTQRHSGEYSRTSSTAEYLFSDSIPVWTVVFVTWISLLYYSESIYSAP